MNILKLSLFAISIVFAIVFTKQVKPEFAVIVSVAGSIAILAYILGFFTDLVVLYNQLIAKTGINQEYFTILLKAIGVGYLVEFASGVCKDSGNSSIADKVTLAGKISILLLAVPIIKSIFEIVSGIIL